MEADLGLGLEELSADDLAALRLSAQVMAHRAALAGLPRVEMFFERVGAEVDAESAARAQLGTRRDNGFSPWLAGALGDIDQATIAEYLELLADNAALPEALRAIVRRLISAQPLS